MVGTFVETQCIHVTCIGLLIFANRLTPSSAVVAVSAILAVVVVVVVVNARPRRL